MTCLHLTKDIYSELTRLSCASCEEMHLLIVVSIKYEQNTKLANQTTTTVYDW